MGYWWTQLKASWHHSLRLLWVIIIALQWLSYTEPFWLRETTASVLLVLTAVALIEILLPVHILYRLIIEAAAIIYIVFRTIKYYGIYTPYPLATFREKLPDITEHMMPYVWFALAAWVLLLLSSWWVSSKLRILMFIGMNIVAFAALDSFTSYILWEEVAWIVFAGMGWLVTQHLRSFQLRYPRGWTYLLDYPLKVAVNVAIIFSLVIITGVNMPGVKPSLTDPYTAWKEWRGGESSTGVKSTGKGTGVGSGTGASGSSTSSGYSLDDDNLGGGFAFDYTPVMTVTTDLRTYMRGETRSIYSGSGWPENEVSVKGPPSGVRVGQLLDNNSTPKVDTQVLQQTVKMLGNNNFPVVFGAYTISTVDSVNDDENSTGLFWRSRDSELLWDSDDRNLAYPQSYVITSEVPVIPVQELKDKSYEDLYTGQNVAEQYLQLPDDFPARVRDLAEEITASAQTPYEKTVLLQQYLQQTFPYTNAPDISRGNSSDFVDSFLFEIKEGYCDYYSTALVTMARSLNIPARWVKGYAPGEQPVLPDNFAMQQQSRPVNNNYTITNADAHSWAEIYYGDYGWVPVEATPGFSVPLLTMNETEPVTDPLDTEDEQAQLEQDNASGNTEENGFQIATWAILAAGAVLLAWLAYMVWHRRMELRFLLQKLRVGQSLSPAQKVATETGRWVRYMRRKGFTKEEHETLRESVENWTQKHPALSDPLNHLLSLFEKSQYSPNVIEDKDWQTVYTEALRLRKILKSSK